MSAAIGASAAGARAYTATASQGLLYMAEALYNASGLGLPIVMTVANRAIGAPINIWNDHSDSMSQRDSRLDPALRRVQPGGGRPARPGVPARRGAVAAGDGLHGRLRPHPRVRARSTSRRRSRSTPSCRRSSRARCSTRTSRSRSARWSGPRRSPRCKYLAHAKQMQALDAIPRSRPSSRRRSAGRPAGWSARYRSEDADTIVVALGSVLGTIEDVVDELRDAGRADRRARHHLLPAVAARRGARRRSAHATRVVVVERAFAVGVGGIVGQNVRLALSGLPSTVYDVVAGLGGRADHEALAARAARRRARRPARAGRLTSSTSTGGSSSASSSASAASGRSGPHAENMLRDLGIVAARSH